VRCLVDPDNNDLDKQAFQLKDPQEDHEGGNIASFCTIFGGRGGLTGVAPTLTEISCREL